MRLKFLGNLKNTITKIIKLGTPGVINEELVTRITLVNSLSLALVILIISVGCVYYMLTKKLTILLPASVEAMLAISPIFLNHYRKYDLAALITFFTQCVASIYFGLLLGNVLELQAMVIFLFLITFLIFKDKVTRRVCIAASIVILLILEINYYDSFVEIMPLNHSTTVIFKALSVIGVLVLIIVVGSPYVTSNDQLHKANYFKKMFVYQVTHEMRTPLNAIYSVAQLLKREVKLDDNLKKITPLIDHLMTASDNARRLINNVLDMAQIESGKMETNSDEVIELSPFISKITDVNKIIAKSRQINVRLSIKEMPTVILCDTLKLNQIFTNLLANAIKYADKKTNIDIIVTGNTDNNTWQMQFINQGNPIPKEKLDSIFEPFVTNKDKRIEGTGLGLYIVQNKVKSMDGEISVSSSVTGKTSFMVTLPLTAASSADITPELPVSIEEKDLSNIHVMVAEDDELNAKLLQMLLNKIGCEVTLTSNGIELLQQIEKKVPDMIIMDYHMQGLNGIQALQQIRTTPLYAHIPVIVATGDVYAESQKNLLNAGANAVIEKPVRHSDLLAIMNKHIRHFDEELQESA